MLFQLLETWIIIFQWELNNFKMVSKRDYFEISSFDPLAIPKLNLKVEELEKERKRIKEFNKKARREKKKPYPVRELENLRNKILYYKKRIKELEENKNKKNKDYMINNIKVIENFKECSLEFYFNQAPYFKTILELKKVVLFGMIKKSVGIEF